MNDTADPYAIAVKEIEALILASASDANGISAERALRISGGFSGLCLLRACVPDEVFEKFESGTTYFDEIVSSHTAKTLGAFLEFAQSHGINPDPTSGWTQAPPTAYQETEPLHELLGKTELKLRAILARGAIAWNEGRQLLALISIRLLAQTESLFPPGMGKALLTDSFIRAAKTVPLNPLASDSETV